ncbi:hypothetical protein ADL26_07370, partial [Thermoactinomyces vulgaris]
MSKQPKYQQVADALRREIDNGTYGPGSRLPSEAELSTRFGASRNTVRSGLSLLVGQGLISSSQGLGYEVRKHEVFELNASRFENLNFPQNGDAYSFAHSAGAEHRRSAQMGHARPPRTRR